jgi:hypothetical protein
LRIGPIRLQGQSDFRRFIHPTAIALAIVFAFSPIQAGAVTQSVFCASAAVTAAPICDKIDALVTASGWLNAHPGVTISVEVLNNSATQLRVILTITAADGRSSRIDRALSVTDTTMTTAMQDRFLQKLLTALPTDI